MKKVILLVVIISGLAWLSGCASGKSLNGFHSGGGGNGSSAFTAGNWAFTTTGGINGTLYMGGYLTSTNSAVTGNLFVVGDTGSGFLLTKSTTSMPVAGAISNNTLTLTGALSGSSITLTFTGLSTSTAITSMTGTYTVTGGTDTGDTGSIAGELAGSYTGIWAGTDITTAGVTTVNMTEATTRTTSGTQTGSFALSPTTGTGVTFAGAAGCTVTGNLVSGSSFVAGGIVFLDVTTTDTGVAGEMTFTGFANDPAAPTSLTNGGYKYTGGSSCMLQNSGNPIALTLTKQ